MKQTIFLQTSCVIKDNNNSPHGNKFHRFLFPFSSKFPDLNFAPYVLYMKPVCDTNSEPELPVVAVSFSKETEGSQDLLRALSVALQATYRAPARIWLVVIDFQNGEQQSRSWSDKKRKKSFTVDS